MFRPAEIDVCLLGAFMALDMVFRLRGQLSRKAKNE